MPKVKDVKGIKGRVNVYLPDDAIREVEELADRFNTTKSGAATLAIQMGLELLRLARSKEFAALLAKEPDMVEKLERMVQSEEVSSESGIQDNGKKSS